MAETLLLGIVHNISIGLNLKPIQKLWVSLFYPIRNLFWCVFQMVVLLEHSTMSKSLCCCFELLLKISFISSSTLCNKILPTLCLMSVLRSDTGPAGSSSCQAWAFAVSFLSTLKFVSVFYCLLFYRPLALQRYHRVHILWCVSRTRHIHPNKTWTLNVRNKAMQIPTDEPKLQPAQVWLRPGNANFFKTSSP